MKAKVRVAKILVALRGIQVGDYVRLKEDMVWKMFTSRPEHLREKLKKQVCRTVWKVSVVLPHGDIHAASRDRRFQGTFWIPKGVYEVTSPARQF